jgi:hypothetical protein
MVSRDFANNFNSEFYFIKRIFFSFLLINLDDETNSKYHIIKKWWVGVDQCGFHRIRPADKLTSTPTLGLKEIETVYLLSGMCLTIFAIHRN